MKQQHFWALAVGLMLGISPVVAQDAKPFTIVGNVGQVEKGSRVRLEYRDNEGRQLDSATVVNGKFTLQGKIEEPTSGTLVLVTPDQFEKRIYNPNRIKFYIEPAVINIEGKGTLENATVTGSKTQLDVNYLEAQKKPVTDKLLPLSEKISALYKDGGEEKHKEEIDSLRNLYMEGRKPITGIEDNFIHSHPSSYLSLDLLNERTVFMDIDSFEPLFNALSPQLQDTKKADGMKVAMVAARKTRIGSHAVDFAQATPAGTTIQLTSLKGKYVLIDFWASWCGPCRAENPNLVKAYNKMKEEGSSFEILAVSLDDKKERWEKAITDDKLTWLHVSDLKGWKNDVAVEYGVRAIPQNLLLDKDGVIIAKDLRGDKLMSKLVELGLAN